MHAADLNNTTKDLPIYLKWVDRITSEFYHQGDQERTRGLEISAICDRTTACVPTSQVSLICLCIFNTACNVQMLLRKEYRCIDRYETRKHAHDFPTWSYMLESKKCNFPRVTETFVKFSESIQIPMIGCL